MQSTGAYQKQISATQKKKTFKVTWDESSTSKDEEQTDKEEVANYTLVAFHNEASNLTKTPLLYYEIT